MYASHIILAYGAVYLASGVAADDDGDSIRAAHYAVAADTLGGLNERPYWYPGGRWPISEVTLLKVGA